MDRILAAIVVLGSLFSEHACHQDAQGRVFKTETAKSSPGPVLSGTINVIAADDQGMVVLTDSMLSQRVPDGHGGWTIRQLPDPYQKLFQIDERTVCVFAGFASAPTPQIPDFLNDTSAIMGRFESSLRDRPLPTISEKMKLLEAIFSHYLTGVANLRESLLSEGDHTIELLLAGYDPDGTPKVGSLILQVQPERSAGGNPLFETVTSEFQVVPVAGQASGVMYGMIPLTGGGFVVVHGQPVMAMEILRQPTSWVTDPAVASYADSETKKKPLTVEQMKALAISLKQHTSEITPSVGGPVQLAVLTGGHIQCVDEPKFSPITATRFKFEIVTHITIDNSGMPVGRMGRGVFVAPGLFTLYFKNSFKRVEQWLDEAYFGGNVFRESRLLYNGGRLQFENSNEVYDSDLILGGVNRDTPEVKHLLNDFKWRHVEGLGEGPKSPSTKDQPNATGSKP